MISQYTLFTIDDSRRKYVDRIRVGLSFLDEIEGLSVNGADPKSLEEARQKHPYKIDWDSWSPRVGHLGIWYGVLNALEQAPIMTIEDDGILGPDFKSQLTKRLKEVPADFDFFSLFIPRDSDHLFRSEDAISLRVTPTYQRYGGVSMIYSKKGAEKIKALLKRDGLRGQYDDTLYAYAKAGELEGYCSRPNVSELVYISPLEDSIVQESERVDAGFGKGE